MLPILLISESIVSAAPVSEPKFQVQNYATCEALEDSIIKIMERYQDRYWYPYAYYGRGGPIMVDSLAEKSVQALPAVAPTAVANDAGSSTSTDPFSTTNTQVAWVDEADIVKTDGTYIYTYSQSRASISIVRMSDTTLVKTIALPTDYSNVQMYLSGNKLVLVGQKYTSTGPFYTYRYFAPESKAIIAVYDVSSPQDAKLERYNQIDGNYTDSRLIGSRLYFLSSTALRIPPYYMTKYSEWDTAFDATVSKLKNDFALKNVVPQIREARLGGSLGRYIQSIRASAASCSDVSFILPDDATLENIDFTPSFVSVSSLDITRPTEKMQTQILFGDVSQIHMSASSLYITSTISQSQTVQEDQKCPENAKCIAPTYQYESSTLIHRYALENGTPKYVYTTKVTGNPMNQYSMDEDPSGNFRIVTQSYAWSSGENQSSTHLSVIDKTGKVIGSLSGLAPGENFQSARFMGNRLYLVTFEQIDPLFVIDLSTPTAPKVLWELKIPGYSTYLHPYDNDRLIGLGYDTFTNDWGGTQNAGLKIDLYNVSDVKNPKQEATLTLGDNGSSSEVLTNPRAFVYYKEKNLLLLPAQISYSAHDTEDQYRVKSVYQGLYGISILPGSITEKFRVTHIQAPADLEKEWRAECAQYTAKGKQVCRKLLDGSEYCTSSYTYVPNYCYADSIVESYLAANLWNYSDSFITRVLYKGDKFYSIAEGGIKAWSLSSPSSPLSSLTLTGSLVEKNYPVMPMMVR